MNRSRIARSWLLVVLASMTALTAFPQTPATGKKEVWKSVSFAIARVNDEAPQSWNIYHAEKRGVLLVKLWKRYLLVNIADQEVFDVDPQTVKPHGQDVEWSPSETSTDPLEIADWKERNVGPVQRVRFRLSKNGHLLELQLPMGVDGRPRY